MTLRRIIHRTFDLETGVPRDTFYTQNPIPEGSTFEMTCEGKTYLFQLDQHFISDEKLSIIEFLGEKT